MWLPFPPLPEQTAIVRFLDHADRRIRRYIRAKQKLIGAVNRAGRETSLINEYRIRLIADVVEEARERGWDALSNGDLLDRAEEAGFEVLITTDQGIQHQQNMSNRRVAVIVLMNTAWPHISKRTEDILAVSPEMLPDGQ